VASAEAAEALVARLLSELPKESPSTALLALGDAMVTAWHGGSIWGGSETESGEGFLTSALSTSWTALLVALLALPDTLPKVLSLLERGSAAIGEATALVSEDDATVIITEARRIGGVGAAACVALALPHDALYDSVLAELAHASPSEAARTESCAPLLLALLLRHSDGALPCLRRTPLWRVLLSPISVAPIAPHTSSTARSSELSTTALLPWLLAELVTAGQPAAAGGLLLERARVHLALRSPGAGLALLQRYLRAVSRAPPSSPSTANVDDLLVTSLPATAAHLLHETHRRCATALQVLVQNLQ
jgi:hypothetical protein